MTGVDCNFGAFSLVDLLLSTWLGVFECLFLGLLTGIGRNRRGQRAPLYLWPLSKCGNCGCFVNDFPYFAKRSQQSMARENLKSS